MRVEGRGTIDRSTPVRFSFDGKTVSGFAGDTVASALLANDIRLMGRSFKYHRPRGPLTAGSEEPNALVQVGTGHAMVPNVRATVQEIHEGLTVASQNHVGPLDRDLMAVNDLLLALPGRGVLLQDLHVAARLLGGALRAAHPPRRRAGADDEGREPRTQRTRLRPLRPAGDRRRVLRA
jgi:hypothetical protein